MKNRIFSLVLAILLSQLVFSQQFTEQTISPLPLTGVYYSSVDWGDYDDDGDLDIILTGHTGTNAISKIYRNEGGNSFTEQSIALDGVAYSSVKWGDYDNDGYLDIVISGRSSPTNLFTKIYKNNNGISFTEQASIMLPGTSSGSVAWADYDNDGDLDISISGSVVGTKIYCNSGNNSFIEQTLLTFPNVLAGSLNWGDYDIDGDLDILLTGFTSGERVAKIYRNNGDNSFTDQTSISLTGVQNSSCQWGDYDNDGDLDILISGNTYLSGSSDPVCKVYLNEGNGILTEQNTIELTGVGFSSVAWGDYDNDGDLDILLTGATFLGPYVSKVYKNNGDNSFSEQTSISLTGVFNSSVAWGDYDNDGDLDILLTGDSNVGPVSKIYRNNNVIANLIPTSPTNLSSSINSGEVNLDWDKSTDNETPQNGLRYNLVIGTTPSAVNILSPMSDRITGYRRVISLGNTNHNNSWTIKGLEPGTYYWSVQAIDNAFAGSVFSTEQSFIIQDPSLEQFTEQASISLTDVQYSDAAWGDYDNDGDLDIVLTGSNSINPMGLSKIFRNDGNNTFTVQTSISLIGVFSGSAAWGDYDNDGDLDILLTGSSGSGKVAIIYRNNVDNTFTEQTSISLTGVSNGSVAWGDYDNDGDLDILLTGNSDSGEVSKIYRNNVDNTFTEQTSISLTGVSNGSVAWGDYDNDSDLDILLTGNSSSGPISKIYRNNGNSTFTEQTSISLTGVSRSSVAWGDYDSDGDLDMILTGNPNGGPVPIFMIYRNNGNNLFTEQPHSYPGLEYGSASWGDCDNDGDLDILVTGYDPSFFGYSAYVCLNNGDNTFNISITDFIGVRFGMADWGDYDNDGDLDILLTGQSESGAVSKIYRNNNLTANTSPASPTNLTAIVIGEDVTLSWDKSTDTETPQNGLKYNLVIGTTPGAVNTLSPMSDRITGYRRIISLGNTHHNNSWTITELELGIYYWSVQAIDNTFAASGFATEETFNTATFQLTVQVTDGWNMVSTPGLHPTNQNVTTWWSGKDPAAGVFRFSGGYLPVTTTVPGEGYWMKHLVANTYNTGDEWPAGGINIVAHDPIAAATGWNLIGGYETSVATSGITTTPAGLQTGQVFQYGTGYTVATNLVPGYGYWIKLTGAGSINIPTSLAKGLAKNEVNTSDWGKLIITDALGNSYTLYTVKGEVNLNDYELPPAPPEGMFDVRFGSGRYAESISAALQTIELNSLEYPVRVRVENADIRLQDGAGNGLNERLKSGEEVTISNSAINKLMVSGEIVPDKYALEQNYPNPFNPNTKIEFSLPEDVNNVTLTIYNTLGQRVAELVNSKLEAGKYSYVWNASDVATGLYIYELRTDKFTAVKKMILLK